METRRSFLKASATAAAVTRSVLGANDRIQMAIIGTGERGAQDYRAFMGHKDQVFVAACDVAKDSLDEFVTLAVQDGSPPMNSYTDYRRILDRKDVDAVLITAPDHQHAPILMAACQAGKDAYVEKPISNAIEPAKQMVDAVHKYNRVVQVGLQQRSWKHFQECAKFIQAGYIGQITHIVIPHSGSYTTGPQATSAPPATLDWEGFQGPAPRRPFKPSRLFFRSWYDYGGGVITDQGVHFVDTANECIQNNSQGPLLTSGVGAYAMLEKPDREQIPDSVQVVWQYEKYTASFINMDLFPPPPGQLLLHGTILYGTKGVCVLNRDGYDIRPTRERSLRRSAQAGDLGARGGRPGRGAAAAPPPLAAPLAGAKSFSAAQQRANSAEPRVDPTATHARNFLDCIKSRQQPVAHIDIGFNSSLPLILGVMAIREGRPFAWDNKTRTAKPV